MKVTFSWLAWEQYTSWDDRKIVRRINLLIEDIKRGDDGGLGRPEMLRNQLSGFSSRRINQEHRLVYRVRGDEIEIISCRFHYEQG